METKLTRLENLDGSVPSRLVELIRRTSREIILPRPSGILPFVKSPLMLNCFTFIKFWIDSGMAPSISVFEMSLY